jgi:HK97 family phage portal protein
VATLQTADGRLLRSSRPAGLSYGAGSFFPSSFPPMWSSGESETAEGELKSYEAIYRSQPILAGAVDKIARRAASLPFAPYRQMADDTREPLPREDSLATLLRRPRPRVSTVHLLAHVFQSLLIHGNALVAKLRTADREAPPVMLWPLDWARVGAYGEPGGDIEWWSTYQFGAQERFIAAADTIHFAWPGPDGGPVGVSPLEKLGITVQLEDASQRYQRANFRNGNRPSNAITLQDPKPSRDLLDMMRAQIDNLHKGVDRAGKTILLGAGATISPLSMSPVEAALIDQRKLNREEISIVYDLGGPSLSDVTDGSLGNVAERNRAFYRDVLPPWTELVVQTFEAQLLDSEPAWLDHVVRFEFSDKLKGEPLEMAEILKSDVEAGIRTRNEARRLIGEEPIGDPSDPENPADQLTVNANNQATLASLNDPPAAAPAAEQRIQVVRDSQGTPIEYVKTGA